MINMRVKTKDVRLSFPVPYAILNLCVAILSSKIFGRQVNKWVQKDAMNKGIPFTVPSLDKKVLKQIVRELKNHHGMVLVNVKTKDGTEVVVKL